MKADLHRMEVTDEEASMRRTVPIAVGTGLAIIVFGGGGLAMAFDGGGAPAGAPVSRTAVRSVAPSGTPISRATAEQIALRAVPGSRIQRVELESEHGVLVWAVRVVTAKGEHDLDIDARTGKVVRDRFAPGDDRRDDRGGAVRPGDDRAGDDNPHSDDRQVTEARHGADDPPGDDHGGHGGDDGPGDDHGGHGGDDGPGDDHGGDA
jgi:uncharacterized membrane protein YkoI